MSSPRSRRGRRITPAVLRAWGLPDPGEDKKARGRIIVVGGSRRSPGAVLLAGEAALRSGAGRLGLAVPGSVEAQMGVVIPEAAVLTLPENATSSLSGTLRDEVEGADAVLVGPGFDDPDETRGTLTAVAELSPPVLVLDAFALGVLPGIDRELLPDALILNPNREEVAILLDGGGSGDPLADLRAVAAKYRAVVNSYGMVAAPDGRAWRVQIGGPGLATSGSGDVLAGAIAGFAAQGMEAERAAVWGSWAQARAGQRLTAASGLGFLARDLAREVSAAVHDVGA
ncbi:ADP/ATP-dependent (S)-NAD(P)H-hydrate dehydratase [Microbacterium sp. 1P10UB]|uniref:ADP-dependent NAD(P)H-hydrate dehydratase n=1 Tax=unclassified Microbacterium TaxID=2609290 RepID=UPI0039A224A7